MYSDEFFNVVDEVVSAGGMEDVIIFFQIIKYAVSVEQFDCIFATQSFFRSE